MSAPDARIVEVVVACPNCGSEGSFFDIEGDAINWTHIQPCDGCDRRLAVSFSVDVQSWEMT